MRGSDHESERTKQIGQLFLIGFGGTTVPEHTKQLIQEFHVGTIMLSAKNLTSATQAHGLILELQTIAYKAGHKFPLLIVMDQENGMLNNIYDPDYVTQFPGAMAIAASGSTALARDIAYSSSLELRAIGVNWILGPVLDVLINSSSKLLGVRTLGDDPEQVAEFSIAMMEGQRQAGMISCGKHFPGYGSATVDSMLLLPVIADTPDQLESAVSLPFRRAISEGIDSMLVGGCALPKLCLSEIHACLSDRVVKGMLREKMGFQGVAVSDCLEMEALHDNIGIRQGAVMSCSAGCDIIMVCHSPRLQREAISGIKDALDAGILEDDFDRATKRIENMKRKYLSWDTALHPSGISALSELHEKHLKLSKASYEKTITLVRDHNHLIPLNSLLDPEESILLLTPLVVPLFSTEQGRDKSHLFVGESVFQHFGKGISKLHSGEVFHTSYTANGMSSMIESLIERSKLILIVTTDAGRNMYQIGLTKHVSVLCQQNRKHLIVIATSSPYDFVLDRSIGTYLCTYEYTNEALDTCAKVLFGKLRPIGTFPGVASQQMISKTHKKWLVEKWVADRDTTALKMLWNSCFPDVTFTSTLISNLKRQTHFIVRNSSTNSLFGFCATWVSSDKSTGNIICLCVDPSRRGMSIGRSLHERAIRYLVSEAKVETVQLGGKLPFFGSAVLCNKNGSEFGWFKQLGWDVTARKSYSTMRLDEIESWKPSQAIIQELLVIGIMFDVCKTDERMEQVKQLISSQFADSPELVDLYKELDTQSDRIILVALEPRKETLVGCIVMFTENHQLAEYQPWLADVESSKVGGICGQVVDPIYHDLKNVFQVGLICSALRQFREKGFETCLLSGVEVQQENVICSMGFRKWRQYTQLSMDALHWKNNSAWK